MTNDLKDGFGFPMTDGFCRQCNAHVLLVRSEQEAELVRATDMMEKLEAAAVFVCNGEVVSCPVCGHEDQLPIAGKIFGPPHPVCPGCGFEFTKYDLAYCTEGALCLGAPEIVDGEPCFVIISEIRCDCGHVLDFDPTKDHDTMDIGTA